MKGRSVLITGATDGIGKATALALVGKGARVVVACRDVEKAEAIRRSSGFSEDQWQAIPCDLSDLEQVREAAHQYASAYGRLDVLINNAGCFTSNLRHTAQGFEWQFGVNHLGHFLLTRALLPMLYQSGDARVINVSSVAYLHGELDLDRVVQPKGSYSGLKAYAASKLANVLFTLELARRNPWLSANALHPGLVKTRLGNKDTHWLWRMLWMAIQPFMCKPKDGAATSIYLSIHPELREVSGSFFDEHQQRRRISGLAADESLAGLLWEKSEEWVAPYYDRY